MTYNVNWALELGSGSKAIGIAAFLPMLPPQDLLRRFAAVVEALKHNICDYRQRSTGNGLTGTTGDAHIVLTRDLLRRACRSSCGGEQKCKLVSFHIFALRNNGIP